jgi:hypothetical protein
MVMGASDPGVAILDRVTLPRAEAPGWVDRLQREYRPSAEARGYTFAGVWQTHADDTDAVEVVVLWTLPGSREFFRSRATSHEAMAWWRETDAVALRRDRRVMQVVGTP